MNTKDEKLIIFGWIITILGIEGEVALNDEKRKKVNELTDKLFEIMRFRPSEALQAPQKQKGEHVPPPPQKPSERLSEARRAKFREVCSQYGVLINDGWNFVSDDFIKALENVK